MQREQWDMEVLEESQKRLGSWTLYSSLNMVWWEIQHKFGYLNIWSFPPYCTGSSCSRNHGLRRCGSSPWSFGELMCSLVSTLMYILHYLPSIAITMILRNWVYIDPLKCVHCWAWSSLINFEDLVHFPLNMDLYGICYLTLVEPCTDPIRASYKLKSLNNTCIRWSSASLLMCPPIEWSSSFYHVDKFYHYTM